MSTVALKGFYIGYMDKIALNPSDAYGPDDLEVLAEDDPTAAVNQLDPAADPAEIQARQTAPQRGRASRGSRGLSYGESWADPAARPGAEFKSNAGEIKRLLMSAGKPALGAAGGAAAVGGASMLADKFQGKPTNMRRAMLLATLLGIPGGIVAQQSMAEGSLFGGLKNIGRGASAAGGAAGRAAVSGGKAVGQGLKSGAKKVKEGIVGKS